jgi:glycosyltransferase involved in cell wall biosynthesis
MKQEPLVSILINNYNKQNYCKQAVRSAISQNYKNIEVIFYDDGSDDNSLKNIIELKKRSNYKIKIIKNSKRGKIYSFNQLNAIKESVIKAKVR